MCVVEFFLGLIALSVSCPYFSPPSEILPFCTQTYYNGYSFDGRNIVLAIRLTPMPQRPPTSLETNQSIALTVDIDAVTVLYAPREFSVVHLLQYRPGEESQSSPTFDTV